MVVATLEKESALKIDEVFISDIEVIPDYFNITTIENWLNTSDRIVAKEYIAFLLAQELIKELYFSTCTDCNAFSASLDCISKVIHTKCCGCKQSYTLDNIFVEYKKIK